MQAPVDRHDLTTGTATVRTTCSYCGVGCGVEATRGRDGRLAVRGDATHPANRGMLCSKGRFLHRVVMDRSDRILYPRLRRRREGPHERVDWDTALGYTAAAFRRILAEHGPDAVGFYVSGQLLTEEYYVANKLVKGFLGTNNIDTNSRLCMSSAVVAYQMALGEDAPPVSYDDLEAGRCFLVAGANPAWCHPILFRRLERHKAAHPDVRIVVVDPRRTQTCALADLHLQLQPGTDVVLFNALAACLVAFDLVDHAFVAAHTEGYDALRRHLAAVSVEEAAAVCRVPADDIRQAARWIGASGAFVSMWAMGLNQSTAGVDKNLALLNLSLLTGQIGRPGAGPFSLTGQPNAMGGREVGGLATTLAAHRDLSNPDHRRDVASFWGVERISERPGRTATEMFDALADGTMKAIWIVCTNPALTLPDLARVERALRRADLVVVQDVSERSDVVAYADVVLPAAGWLEKQGTMTSSERRVTYLPRLVAPPGEARPDAWILCGFAEKMGWGASFGYADEAEIYAEHAALTRGTRIDVSGLSHARLRRERSVQWPCPSVEHPGTPRLFADGRFWTPTGRARLHAVAPAAPAAPPGPDHPLVLTTGRTRDQWHTRTRTGKVKRLDRHTPIPTLEIHPDDAAACGLADGRPARVTSPHGTLTVRAAVTDAVKPGVVFLPMHWGRTLDGRGDGERDGRANRLTSPRVDPRSKQPDYKYTAVRVERVAKARERVVVVGGGAAARRFVERYRELDRDDEIHVFGREPYGFYNRILLPDYVGGTRAWAALGTMTPDRLRALDVHLHAGTEIVRIDRAAREVEDAGGRRHPYDRLLLATGSRAFVPDGVPVDREGVFTLRTRDDADRIRRYVPPGGRVVVMGGGLLGLELAAALHAAGLRCTIVEAAPRLMHRQLDPTASEMLRDELAARGVDVYCDDAVVAYPGAGRLRGVVTRAGRRLACDALLVAVGTRPNVELAADAGLDYGRGVLVNEHLQTSDPVVYAAGEVAERDGRLWGITAAAEEQAAVAAEHMTGDPWAVYEGSVSFNILKIEGFDVCAVGLVPVPEAGYEDVVLLDRRRRRYKRCVVENDRLVGAVLVGDRSEFDELRALVASGIELEEQRDTLLQSARAPAEPVEGRLVCSCNHVGAGNIERRIRSGCTRLDDLCRESRAGTGCGSCRPEVRMLLDAHLAAAADPLPPGA